MRLKVAHVYTNYAAFSHPYLRVFSQMLGSYGVDLRLFSRLVGVENVERCTALRMLGCGRRLRSDLHVAWRSLPKSFEVFLKTTQRGVKDLRGAFRKWADILPLFQESWNVIHIMNWPLYRLLASYLLCTKTRFILSCRGYEILFGMEENMEWKQDAKEVWERASVIHCVSRFLADKAIERGAPETKVRVIYPGVDVNFFRPEKCCQEREICHIVTVARLTWEKALELGLLVAKRLMERGVPIVYHVIGDGPFKTALQCWADRLKLGGRVCWHGALPSENVRKILSGCDVYLHPSVSESFGVAVVEAMALGLPVVASRVGGIPEIVEHEKTGFLLELDDIDGMADGIEKIWNSRELRMEMSVEARRQAVKKFSIDREVREWVDLYHSVSERP